MPLNLLASGLVLLQMPTGAPRESCTETGDSKERAVASRRAEAARSVAPFPGREPVTKLSCNVDVLANYQQEPGRMRIETTSDNGAATARVALTGRLDIAGAEVVALPLATLAGAKQGLIIDMSGVSFIASIGIRHLVSAAKTLSRRNG